MVDENNISKGLIKQNGFDTDAIINIYEFNQSYSQFVFNTTEDYLDDEQAYAIGYAEGNLLAQQIVDHRTNLFISLGFQHEFPKHIRDFGSASLKHLNGQIQQNKSVFWYGVQLTVKQFEGMSDGVRTALNISFDIIDIYLMNSYSYIKSIISFSDKRQNLDENQLRSSGVVVTDLKDLFLAFQTAEQYEAGFAKIAKTYITNYNHVRSLKQHIQTVAPAGILMLIDGILTVQTEMTPPKKPLSAAVIINQYMNFNKTLYGPENATSAELFALQSTINQVPPFLNAVAGALTSSSAFTFSEDFLKFVGLQQVVGVMFVDISQFQEAVALCGINCTRESLVQLIKKHNFRIAELIEHARVRDVSQELVESGYGLLLNTPQYATVTQTLLNTSSEGFFDVDDSIRGELLRTYLQNLTDPISVLKSLLTFNDGGEALNSDHREGFAPRYDIRRSSDQFGAVSAVVTSTQLFCHRRFVLRRDVPDSTQKFTVEQLRLHGDLRGDLRLSPAWSTVSGCGPAHFEDHCRKCQQNYSTGTMCEGCADGFVPENGRCLHRFDSSLGVNRTTSLVLEITAGAILATAAGLFVWLARFVSLPKVELKVVRYHEEAQAEEESASLMESQ